MIGSQVKRRGVVCSGRTLVEGFARETAPSGVRVEDAGDVPVIPRAPRAAGDVGGPWHWCATFLAGGDVVSLPFDTFEAAWADAEANARPYLASEGEGFRSISIRRVVH